MPIKRDPPPLSPFRTLAPPRWVLVSCAVATGLALAAGALTGVMLNADLPDVRNLEDYQPPTISQILSSDGTVIHTFAEQKRIVVPIHRINTSLRQAVIAVEDSNFNEHVGVDPKAIARALLRDIKLGRYEEGGSTLTQQLAKILFLSPEKTIRRKLQEAMLAMHIEKAYTKSEILQFYLNQIYMGHGRYGVEAAARYYFDKSAADLDLPQAALLAGIIQRPESYTPLRHPERAVRRRNKVLTRMLAEGFISGMEETDARESPIDFVRQRADNSAAAYFAEEIRKTLAPRFGAETLLREGMVIKTGLDIDLQRTAHRALSRGLRSIDKRRGFRPPTKNILLEGEETLEEYKHPGWERPVRTGDVVTGLVMDVAPEMATIRIGTRFAEIYPDDAKWTKQSDLSALLTPGDLTLFEVRSVTDESLSLDLDQEPEVEGAVLAMDPHSGDIRAMVGGFDFDRSEFNRATQAKRQSGSAFKPFIYAAAVAAGRRPSDLVFDEPTVFVNPRNGETYQPENYNRRYLGVITLRRALEKSVNIPTVTLLNEIGYSRTVNFARRLGFSSRLHPYPSLALGSSEVTLQELTAAYGAFPTGGILSTPRLYQEIRDRDGNLIDQVRRERKEVLREDVAGVMVSMMQGVVQNGTAKTASSLGTALAGKTGTTDDYTDAWFVGYSPTLVVGVWVGHDLKVTLGPKETGAKAALPVWMEVMRAHLEKHPADEFPSRPGVVVLPVDSDTGLRVAPELGCRKVIMETFIQGTEIERPCTGNAHFRAQLPYWVQRYPMLADGRTSIGDIELDRLLRENPFQLELYGKNSLSVTSTNGMRLVRLARDDKQGGDISWGVFQIPARYEETGENDEQQPIQWLPETISPIDTGPMPFVGLDGRSAATIGIRSH